MSKGQNNHVSNGAFKRCYHDHPPYEIAPGVIIYGGSGNDPAVTDADVYIGFDHGMKKTPARFPWHEGDEVHFIIQDMNVPDNLEEFKHLLEWTKDQLLAGKKVHAGCIGGHGRTGLFFAALRKLLVPDDEDAITHVRTNYCKKTVESIKQVDWLHTHFGIKKVEATKQSATGNSTLFGKSDHQKSSQKYWQPPINATSGSRSTGKLMNRAASIWGA